MDPREARDLVPIEVNSVARTSSNFVGTSTGGLVSRLDGPRQPMTIVGVTYKLSLKGLRYQQQLAPPGLSLAISAVQVTCEDGPESANTHRLLQEDLARWPPRPAQE